MQPQSEPRCYRSRHEDELGFKYSSHSDPRRLVESRHYDYALNNVDNYVSWAMRRFVHPKFGCCRGPEQFGDYTL